MHSSVGAGSGSVNRGDRAMGAPEETTSRIGTLPGDIRVRERIDEADFMTRRGYRERAVGFLERAGGLNLLLRLRARRPSPWLTVLTYHRVADPEEETAADRGVIDATPAQFEDQVAYLSRHYTIIGIDELLHYTRTGKLPPNSVLITFDDGYRDALTTAVPILRRYGARAAFFIPTQYPGGGRAFWWDRIAYLIRRSPHGRIELDEPWPLTLRLEGDRQAAVTKALALAKRDPEQDFDALVEALAAVAGVPWNESIERELASRLIMSWDEIQKLVELGMDVESHTRSHRILAHLGSEEAAWELFGSREDLRQHLGYAPRAVAYPVGAPLVHRPDIIDSLRDAGYELGYTNCTGSNDLRRTLHPLDVNRIGMDVALSPELFRGMLALPPLGYATPKRGRSPRRASRDPQRGARRRDRSGRPRDRDEHPCDLAVAGAPSPASRREVSASTADEDA